jgi:hypothetical protein
MRPWSYTGEHIVVIGQTLYGLSSQHCHIYAWYRKAVATIRRATARPIVFRQHPRLTTIRSSDRRKKQDIARVQRTLGSPANFRFSDNPLLAHDLKRAWAVVVFTSNAAVEAVVKGVPLFAGDRGCVAWPVAATDLAEIEAPRRPPREQWGFDLAYAQWNCREMAAGDTWAHLRTHVEAERPAGVGLRLWETPSML